MTKSRTPEPPPGARKISDEESALWRQVMEDVRRLPKAKHRPADAAGDESGETGAAARPMPPRPLAPRPPAIAAPPARPSAEPPLEHGEAPGLDKRTRLRLRRGQVEIQGVIDLHGLTQTEAHRALAGFLDGAHRAGKRSVLVITGKGLSPGTGVLRAAVPRWLNEPSLRRMIRAFSHAAPKDGGEGALYVLLRRKR